MPVYEYACPNCRNIFEEWLKVSEATESAPCPKCGSQARHIISNTAFVLKGNGWYVTDYGYRKGASEDGQTTASDSEISSASSGTDASEQSAIPTPAAASSQPASAAASGASA
ncbi:MAG: zinc ribbon domain-containing protein [Desulfovibrionaceae bacterium]|nr:zinc ribbon domain-containing protein [Desulfovibrionaceae bacterium]